MSACEGESSGANDMETTVYAGAAATVDVGTMGRPGAADNIGQLKNGNKLNMNSGEQRGEPPRGENDSGTHSTPDGDMGNSDNNGNQEQWKISAADSTVETCDMGGQNM